MYFLITSYHLVISRGRWFDGVRLWSRRKCLRRDVVRHDEGVDNCEHALHHLPQEHHRRLQRLPHPTCSLLSSFPHSGCSVFDICPRGLEESSYPRIRCVEGFGSRVVIILDVIIVVVARCRSRFCLAISHSILLFVVIGTRGSIDAAVLDDWILRILTLPFLLSPEPDSLISDMSNQKSGLEWIRIARDGKLSAPLSFRFWPIAYSTII